MNLGKENLVHFVQLKVNSSACSLSTTLCMCPWNTACKCTKFISNLFSCLSPTRLFSILSPDPFSHNWRLLVKQFCEKSWTEQVRSWRMVHCSWGALLHNAIATMHWLTCRCKSNKANNFLPIISTSQCWFELNACQRRCITREKQRIRNGGLTNATTTMQTGE